MKFKASKLRNYFFILVLSIVFHSCNEDYNTVGYDLISTNAFETDRIKLPVFSYQKESLTDIQTNGLVVQQLGTIDVPNVGRSSAYIISQLNMPTTNFFGLYSPSDELGVEDNARAIAENEQVTSAYLEIPFLNNVRDQDGDGVIDSLDEDPLSITSDSDGDSISDALETQNGTNPLSKDSDGDGILDFEDTDNSGYAFTIHQFTYSQKVQLALA